ncbi:MAG: LysR substrate-binding domain-containing protein [Cyanobacteria bacterium]|nr:LysR substrate-binding domain-containing protein [Cyanobacteriota bacterium]
MQTALRILSLETHKFQGEWALIGDTSFIDLELKVHQLWRWNEQQPLRLEAQRWSGPLLCVPPPAGWIKGNFDCLDYQRPIELLRKGIIDAWVASYPDIPDDDDPEIASIRLNRMPMLLLVSPNHPLLELGEAITMVDIARYPSMALPDGAFPKFQEIATQCGIWNIPNKQTSFKYQDWYGRMDSNDLAIAYGTPLSLQLLETTKVILPVKLPIEVGDALLLRRSFLQSPQTEVLHRTLIDRLHPLAEANAEIQLLL